MRADRTIAILITLLLAMPALRAVDILGTVRPAPPLDVRICAANAILLSRGGTPVAVLALRDAGAPERAPLDRDAALAVLKDAALENIPEGAERILPFRLRLNAEAVALDALMKITRVGSGFRVLLTGEQVASAAPRGVVDIYCFPDALARTPRLTYANAARVLPRPAAPGGEVLRARSVVYETTPPIDSLNPKQLAQDPEKDLRVHVARSAPVDWTVRALEGGVLLSAGLLPAPRSPDELGAFVLYVGTDADAGRAELSPIRLNKKETPARDFLEGALRVYASGANPFALTELAVVAEIALPPTPAGEVEIKRLPCFFWESGSKQPAEGEFRFRFAPPQEGVYGVRISLVTATGQMRTDAVSFRAGPPASRGFVKAAPRSRVLAYDDGTLFEARPWKLTPDAAADGERARAQFRAMNRAGANCARVNIAFGLLRLEGPKLGEFDADAALKLEDLLLGAQVRDLHLLLAVEDALAISLESPTHPYFRESGGPLSATPEFFRNPAVKRAFQSRLAYVAARFGAYRSVLGWDLAEQVDRCWAPLKNDPGEVRLTPEESDLARRARRDVQDWLANIALSMRGMDGHGHPVGVSTELDAEKKWPDIKKVEHLDALPLPPDNP